MVDGSNSERVREMVRRNFLGILLSLVILSWGVLLLECRKMDKVRANASESRVNGVMSQRVRVGGESKVKGRPLADRRVSQGGKYEDIVTRIRKQVVEGRMDEVVESLSAFETMVDCCQLDMKREALLSLQGRLDLIRLDELLMEDVARGRELGVISNYYILASRTATWAWTKGRSFGQASESSAHTYVRLERASRACRKRGLTNVHDELEQRLADWRKEFYESENSIAHVSYVEFKKVCRESPDMGPKMLEAMTEWYETTPSAILGRKPAWMSTEDKVGM